jgi:phenylpyruvate tautomerase PptA (4-oxalocrotonate tautomerase family)
MPLVRISMKNIWYHKTKKYISDRIHEALVEAFKIKDSDYNHQITEFNDDNYLYSANKSEKFILIEMTIFPGRSKEAKSKLYQLISEKLKKYGIEPNDILTVIYEPPMENWGLGDKSALDINFDYQIDV